MARIKILITSVILMGLIILSPISVFGEVTAPSSQQRIYSVTEIDSPSPYHITLLIRTGLDTGNVWIQGADGNSTHGILVSYGDSQRVWQISYITSQDNQHRVVINANHDYVMDGSLISQIYRPGSHGWVVFDENDQPGRMGEQFLKETTSPGSAVNHTDSRDETVDSESETPSWKGIKIIGDDQFVQRTIRAMEAVERGPRWAYDYIVTYLDYVEQHSLPKKTGTGGHINVRTRTFYVYNRTYMSDEMWYASTLVHEAVHARQYQEYLESYGGKTPRRITFYSTFENQMEIEMEALDIQIRFLEEADASEHLINCARSYIGTVWWR